MDVLSSRVSSLQTKGQSAVATRDLGLGGPDLATLSLMYPAGAPCSTINVYITYTDEKKKKSTP